MGLRHFIPSAIILLVPLSLCSCAPWIITHQRPSSYEVGLSYFQKGDLVAAIQEWERVRPEDRHFGPSKKMMNAANGILSELVTLHLRLGSNLEKEGRLTEALREYRRATLLDPRRGDAKGKVKETLAILAPLVKYHLSLAKSYEEEGKLQEALTEYRLVQVFDPDDPEAQEKVIRLSDRIESEARAHYEAGLHLFRQTKYHLAEREMKLVLYIKPDHEGARRYLEAIEKFLQEERAGDKIALTLNLELKERRARLQELIIREDWIQARKEARSLLEIDPYDQEVKDQLSLAEARYREKVEAFFQRGIQYFLEERLDLAISMWRSVLTMDPNHLKAKEYLEKANLMREKIRHIREQRDGLAS